MGGTAAAVLPAHRQAGGDDGGALRDHIPALCTSRGNGLWGPSIRAAWLGNFGAIPELRHGRRIWLSFGVTENPTAEWISRQITEAFPWDDVPRYLIRDRDTSYGPVFVQRLRAMGIRDRPIAFRSPWQNAYVERLIGSIRRECLDHMIVFGEAHLRRIL